MNPMTIHLTCPENPGTFQTDLIQAALDQCRDNGCGEVILGDGDWHIASIRMYSNTTLHLSAGTHLIASDNFEDYTFYGFRSTLGYLESPFVVDLWNLPPYYAYAPVVAVEAENVAVIGEPGSWIDGSDCLDPNGEEKFRGPMGMVFSKCRSVTLKGYTYRNAANWCHQLDSCMNVHMDGVTVLGGHDGINIHHCEGVLIENCDFRTGDDCIAGYNTQNVIVRNCQLNTSCSSFRIGGKNLLVENCRFWGPGEYPHRVSGRHNTLYVIEYYAMRYDVCHVDSENWVFRNCTFDNIDGFIHYRYGHLWLHDARPLRDMTLENVQITNLLHGSILNPVAGNPLTITMKNVSVGWRNGLPATKKSDSVKLCNEVPEKGFAQTTPDVKVIMENVTIEGINA